MVNLASNVQELLLLHFQARLLFAFVIAFSSTSIVVTLLWAMAKRKQENMDVDMEDAAQAKKCAIMVWRCEHCKCDLTNQRWAGWWKNNN